MILWLCVIIETFWNPMITDTITVSEQHPRDVIAIRIRKRKASGKLFRKTCPISQVLYTRKENYWSWNSIK